MLICEPVARDMSDIPSMRVSNRYDNLAVGSEPSKIASSVLPNVHAVGSHHLLIAQRSEISFSSYGFLPVYQVPIVIPTAAGGVWSPSTPSREFLIPGTLHPIWTYGCSPLRIFHLLAMHQAFATTITTASYCSDG